MKKIKKSKTLCLEMLGDVQDSFQVDWIEVKERLSLKDDYKEIKNEIIAFFYAKADNGDEVEEGEIETLSHFLDLPCDLETALTYEADIKNAFDYYVWAMIQCGIINPSEWQDFNDAFAYQLSRLCPIE